MNQFLNRFLSVLFMVIRNLMAPRRRTLVLVELRYFTTTLGVQCVILGGESRMPMLSAGTLVLKELTMPWVSLARADLNC